MAKKELSPLSAEVKNIYLSGFQLDESLYKENEKLIDINIGQITMFKVEEDLGSFTITYGFVYKDSQALVLEIKVTTVFNLIGLKNFLVTEGELKGKIHLPTDALITCLSLSLSHSRVFLHQNVSNTIYGKQILLPVFNPTELAKSLYKDYQIPVTD